MPIPQYPATMDITAGQDCLISQSAWHQSHKKEDWPWKLHSSISACYLMEIEHRKGKTLAKACIDFITEARTIPMVAMVIATRNIIPITLKNIAKVMGILSRGPNSSIIVP